jgi:hypothetical protein
MLNPLKTENNVAGTTSHSQTEVEVEYYSLDYKFTGLAVMIHNFEFRDRRLPDFSEEVCKIDVKSFETLKNFNFQVDQVYLNQTKVQIFEIIKKYTEDFDYSDYACIFFCISSHGEQNTIMSTDYNPDDETYSYVEAMDIQEDIIEPFYKVKSLKNKPKIFLFDCCRGYENMTKGMTKGLADGDNNIVNKNKNTNTEKKEFKFADLSNFFFAYATLPNFVSNCSKRRGSFLISAFFEVLDKYGKTDDWDELKRKMTMLLEERYLQVPIFEKSNSKFKLAFVKQLEIKKDQQVIFLFLNPFK